MNGSNNLSQELSVARETIRSLQGELTETNRGLLALTIELEDRVDLRTTELRSAEEELQKTNSDLMQLTLELEDRVAERTEALAESEARYRLLFESNPLPMWVYDLETLGFLAVNDAAIRHYGYTREEFLGMTIKDIRPPEDLPALLKNVASSPRDFDRTDTWRHLKKDGTLIDVEITSHLIHFSNRRARLVLASDVTQRRRAEEALRQSESLKDAILKSALDCVIVIDHDGKIVAFNRAAESTFGYSRDQAVGKSMVDLIVPPRLRESHKAGFKKYLNTGESQILGNRIEMSAVRADGGEFPVELSITAVGSPNRPVFTGFVRDITQRKMAEEALHETNQKLKTFIHASPLAIVALDMERQVTLWNPAAERFFGWTESEVLGQVLPTIPEEDLPNQLALREQFLQSDGAAGISDLETRRMRKDGSKVDVSVSVAPLQDAQGVMTGTIGIIADISDRKRAEEQLRLQSAALGSAANGILITDDQGKIIWVNPAFSESTGYSQEEVIGRTPRFLKSGMQDPEFYREMWDTILAGKVWRNTVINRRKNGTLYHEDMTITPIRNHGGKITHFVAIKQDITQLQQALAQLKTKNEELASMTQQLWQASKLATMGELAASVAHELNNPLATVALRTEMLVDQLSHNEELRQSAQVVLNEVERMADLVDNLMQFSRRSYRQISTVDPTEELANSINFVAYYLRNRNVKVVTEFAENLPTIQADRQQLRQLFLNLLTNASDAMSQGGKLAVSARPTHLDGAAAVAVDFADTGEGISAENLEKIWEPFFTTKAEGKGTGLGLAICRRIIEEHGGTIEIESQTGRGTMVHIVFPATNGEQA